MRSLLDVEVYAVSIPMRMRFRRVSLREAILLHGPEGWGEFSPFPDYPAEVTNRWLAAALESACTPWPAPVRDSIPVNVTVPAIVPEAAAELVRSSGCSTAKVKVAEVGRPFEEDVARLAAVREALGPEGRLRIDVNATWSVDEAAERLTRLAEFDLEYVEQPVSAIDELLELRRRVDVSIAADESVRLAADPMDVVRAGAVDLLVLKVQPLGGVGRLLDLAERSGLPIVVSSALDTSVGLAAGVAAAAALPTLDLACGLGTGTLLVGDVVEDPLVPVDGAIAVRRPEPTPELLGEWRADRETELLMMRRLRDAAELLT
jgi:O-succinylbenzoate synthase